MSDIMTKKMDDVLDDDIEKKLNHYAEYYFEEQGYKGEIEAFKKELKSNLGATKDTKDEESYEKHIRKLAESLQTEKKAIGDYTSFKEMLEGVRKDSYKGFEHLKAKSQTKTKSEAKKNKTNEKIGIAKRNRLMPTKIGKKTTLKQKLALILSDGIIMKVPFVEQFVDDQLKSIKQGEKKTVSSKSMRRKMLESLGFKGVSHSKAKENAAKSKTKTAEKSQGR